VTVTQLRCEPFAQLNADPKVLAFFPKFLTALESNALVESFKDFIDLNVFGFWAVELKSTKEFIGFFGFDRNPR
jgi:hypothetical protein